MKEAVKSFLTKYMIAEETVDMKGITEALLNEMQAGLDGKKSSLAMINSYCADTFEIKPGQNAVVIDAGGTNFRTCLVTFDYDSQPVITDFQVCPMPGSQGEVTSEEFFGILADKIQNLVTKSDRIGFCFSYQAQITPDHDGFPTAFSKEIQAKSILGKHLGHELFEELNRRGIDTSNKKIMILNDTVTTLLAGLSKSQETESEGCVGFILGTGTNCAYSENGVIINEESGNYEFAPGEIDKEFISRTKDPTIHWFEKLISGAYLGRFALDVLKKAKEDGVIDCELPKTMSTKEFGETLVNKSMNKDCLDILDAVLQRAAMLTAANIASSVVKSGYGKDKPCLVNADGSTFYKTADLQNRVITLTNQLLKDYGRKAVFCHIENSPTIGSAIGALTI